MVPRCLAGARELATTPALAERDLVNFPPRQVFPFLLFIKVHIWLNCFISSEANWEGTREGADLPSRVVRRPLPQDWCHWPLHGSLRSLHLPCLQGIVLLLTPSSQVLSLYLSSNCMISIPQNWLHPGILRHGARLLRGHGPRHRHDLPYQDTGPRLHRGVSAWSPSLGLILNISHAPLAGSTSSLMRKKLPWRPSGRTKLTPALPRFWDRNCFYNIVYYALFLQIKGEQAVQEQATAWQDIIAAKKEAVGLQVEIWFYPTYRFHHTFWFVGNNTKLSSIKKTLTDPWLTVGGRIQKQACRCSLRCQEEAGLPGFHLPSVLLVSNRSKNRLP